MIDFTRNQQFSSEDYSDKMVKEDFADAVGRQPQ